MNILAFLCIRVGLMLTENSKVQRMKQMSEKLLHLRQGRKPGGSAASNCLPPRAMDRLVRPWPVPSRILTLSLFFLILFEELPLKRSTWPEQALT